MNRRKKSGTLPGVPFFPYDWAGRLVLLLTALFLATLLGCHGSILPSILHGCNKRTVAVVECIESMKNEVKRKMETQRQQRAMTVERSAALDTMRDKKN
jgi:hypothetical protein